MSLVGKAQIRRLRRASSASALEAAPFGDALRKERPTMKYEVSSDDTRIARVKHTSMSNRAKSPLNGHVLSTLDSNNQIAAQVDTYGLIVSVLRKT